MKVRTPTRAFVCRLCWVEEVVCTLIEPGVCI